MYNARFWTGLVFLGGLPMSLVVGAANWSDTRKSPLEGRVQHNGHPVARGVIWLRSEDQKRSADVMAAVDENGRFVCSTYWHDEEEGRVRFHVQILTDPIRDEGAATPSPDRVTRVECERVRPVQMPAFGGWEPFARPSIPVTLGAFDVTLGPEPTQLDIELKD